MNLVTLVGQFGAKTLILEQCKMVKAAALSVATSEKWTDKQTGVKKAPNGIGWCFIAD